MTKFWLWDNRFHTLGQGSAPSKGGIWAEIESKVRLLGPGAFAFGDCVRINMMKLRSFIQDANSLFMQNSKFQNYRIEWESYMYGILNLKK